MAGNFDPSLGIEVGKDAIRVIDMNTKALVASAPLARVTATPAKHEEKYRRRRGALPILVVCIPGAQRLTIGCIEPAQGFGQRLESIYRFWSQDPVPQEKAPDYFVSSADWLTLVEKFGLATQLEDSQPLESPAPPAPSPEPSPLYSQPRWMRVMRWAMVGWLAVWLVSTVVVIFVGFVFHQW